jgi:hypothetical protein
MASDEPGAVHTPGISGSLLFDQWRPTFKVAATIADQARQKIDTLRHFEPA